MSFSIEITKNGKQNILFNYHKYRESYSLKSGETVWRCLGRSCGATLKTDPNRTSVTVTSTKHSGPHPVTMRSHSPQHSPGTPAGSSAAGSVTRTATLSTARASSAVSLITPSTAVTPPSATSTQSAAVPCTPVMSSISPSTTSTSSVATRSSMSPSCTATPLSTVTPLHTPVSCSDTTLTTGDTCVSYGLACFQDRSASDKLTPMIDQPIYHKPSCSTPALINLEVENTNLKNQINDLNQQLKCVLDHSIESDTRLLQYTDQVFTSNSSRTEAVKYPSTTECAVQCDPPTTCQNEHCIAAQVLITSMKTTIEVLEAEIQSLKGCDEGLILKDSLDWTVVKPRAHCPIDIKNRYECLNDQSRPNYKSRSRKSNANSARNDEFNVRKTRNVIKTRPRTLKQTNIMDTSAKECLRFSSINVEGDSHGRLVAGLVRGMVNAEVKVTGVCKPGAKLLNVISSAPPPPDSCTVVMAGTNDVACGQLDNIYQHLEKRITSLLSSAKVVVATLPHRHDLAFDHPVNRQTILANRFIKSVCGKHQGVEMVDLNRISRRFFTRHGMHLRMPGKRLLARLVLESVKRVGEAVITKQPQPSAVSCESSEPSESAVSCESVISCVTTVPCVTSPTPLPKELPYETFADAVKAPRPSKNDNCQNVEIIP